MMSLLFCLVFCRLTNVKFEQLVLLFFRGCLFCDNQQRVFLINFLKLMIKNPFYVNHLNGTEMVADFFSELLDKVDVLDLPLKKVLVSVVY